MRLHELLSTYSQAPALARYESTLVVLGVLLAPLWIIGVPGMHFTGTDICFILAAVSYIVRTRSIPVLPSRLTLIGIGLFLSGGLVGLTQSPIPVQSAVDLLQYCLIFLVIVPMAYISARDRNTRKWMYVAIFVVFLGLVAATYEGLREAGLLANSFSDLLSVPRFRRETLFYGNKNQLYWMIAIGVVFSTALVFNSEYKKPIRVVAVAAILPALYLVMGSLTFTAAILVAVAFWMIGRAVVQRINASNQWPAVAYSRITVILFISMIVFVVTQWEFVYYEGNLDGRFFQYSIVIETAREVFPIGIGFQSAEVLLVDRVGDQANPSIHNAPLSHLVEAGLLGFLGFVIFISAWIRDVGWRAYRQAPELSMDDFAPIGVFAGFIILMMFQPAPILRMWWIIFGISWSVVIVEFRSDLDDRLWAEAISPSLIRARKPITRRSPISDDSN